LLGSDVLVVIVVDGGKLRTPNNSIYGRRKECNIYSLFIKCVRKISFLPTLGGENILTGSAKRGLIAYLITCTVFDNS